MISLSNLKNDRFRVTVKFPHDTPALVGEMLWNNRHGEYVIRWDEGQQYNKIDLENWFDKVDDVYVYIEDESDARLGGRAMVMYDRELVTLDERLLMPDIEEQYEMKRRESFPPSSKAWSALNEATEYLRDIKWGDPKHIEWSIDAALSCMKVVAANDIDVLSRAMTTCYILWSSRPLEKARFQRIVDEEFAKRA